MKTLIIAIALTLLPTFARAQVNAIMVARTIGVTLTVQPNFKNVAPAISLTGATVTLRTMLHDRIMGNFPCTVSVDGTNCTYTTVSTSDFPDGGVYQPQLVILTGSGQTLRSILVPGTTDIAVGNALTGTP